MRVIFHFFEKDKVEVEAYKELNILAHGQLIERNLQSRCGGHCECSTCRVRILSGKVSEMHPEERALLKKVGVNDPAIRLSCQCFPDSDVVEVEVLSKKFSDAREG